MLRKICFRKRSATLVLLVFGLLLGAAGAQTETVLYSFCSQTECGDGQSPYAGVVFDQKGNLYGTTRSGGASNNNCVYGCGVVFKLTPKGKETVLYSFCAQGNCADGADPQAGLVLDQKGNLYGTTYLGGAYDGCESGLGCGVVFKLTPEGKYKVLYSFCAQNGCTDGAYPQAGLVLDQNGNLYGTTSSGGTYNDYCAYGQGCGVAFKLTPKGKETVLYTFCGQTNCTDGGDPVAGLTFDKNGSLYGTTEVGGEHRSGVVFKLTPEGRETVLYSFCWQNDCADGTNPFAGLVFDRNGNMYGTTSSGGEHHAGVVFKLTPKGKETVLFSFSGSADGANPEAGLVFDQKGNLYGTTFRGGDYGGGVVFKITP
jgi:uncharacterized repeat protein (TIGR03803 family)